MIELSAIILTYNEEENIRNCLESLTWLPEVIVIDSGSSDKTVETALKYDNVKVYSEKWLGYVENKRIAVAKTSYDWVLWIDADEVTDKKLQEEIKEIFKEKIKGLDVLSLARRNFFLGKWIRHTGWYPGIVHRIFNKQKVFFNTNILHEGLNIQADHRTYLLEHDLLHYSYRSLYQYFDKMNKYGKYGARELERKNKKVNAWIIIFNPLFTFFKFFFIKKGYLDGIEGLIISIGSGFSNFIKYTHYYFLKKRGYREDT